MAKAQEKPELSLEKKDPTCSGNGVLSASLTNSQGTDNLIFNLYRLPETEPINSSSSGEFKNLQPGEYRVESIFDFNEEKIELSEEIFLESQIVPLSFSISSEFLCQNNLGTMEVLITMGNPETYQIINGPEIRPQQASPVFENLPKGTYTILVTDECGDRLTQTFQNQNAVFQIDDQLREVSPELESCDEINIGHYVRSAGGKLEYPLDMVFTITKPEGSEEVVEIEILEGEETEGYIYGNIPFYAGQPYHYDLSITDNCGQTATLLDNTIETELSISNDLLWGAGLCGKRKLSIQPQNFTPPYNLNFISHPKEFDPELFNPDYPGPFTDDNTFFGSEENPIPFGFYEIEISDACGRKASVSRTYNEAIPGPSTTVYKGCGPNTGSLQIFNYDYELTKVEMTKAPAEFGNTFPLDLSENISKNNLKTFYLNNLPAGEYHFLIATSCNTEHTTEVKIEGPEVLQNEIEVFENCRSFNLFLEHRDNLSSKQITRFGLQKFDPELGQWTHPETGNPYLAGEELSAENSVILTNGATNINLNYFGELRVAKSIKTWRNGVDIQASQASNEYCLETLHSFNIKERSSFEYINTFQCVGENYELSVKATGYEPINYRIVLKDGQPFLVENGEDPLFSNLEPGRYQLQLEDNCGNLTNATVQIIGENLPKIIPQNLCEGETGKLSIENLDFLQYEWYREDEPGHILSNSSSLEFAPFNLADDQGIYKVRLSHANPESCLNEILEFDINENNLNPLPGEGQDARICQGEIIDLFDYLEGPFNDFGKWRENTNSGGLIGNLWSSVDIEPGEYEFEYTTTGICAGEQSTRVNITVRSIPNRPTGEPIQEFCGPSTPAVRDLEAEGQDILWFLKEFGGEPLDLDFPLESGQFYYAEQHVDECGSERLQVQLIIYNPLTNNIIQEEQKVYQMEAPGILTGSLPEGGKGEYLYQWESKNANLEWGAIADATGRDYQPPPLLESTSFRRITIDEFCGEEISNEVLVTVEVAEIIAVNDRFGLLKNFQINELESILMNDGLKGEPAEMEEVSIQITDITDESGYVVELDYILNEDGTLTIDKGNPARNYTLTYQLCQALVPENCDTGEIKLWLAGIEVDVQKEVDKTQAVEGEMATYTIYLKNNSPFTLENIRVEDLLPDGLFLISTSSPTQDENTWIIPSLEQESVFETQLEVMAMEPGEYINSVTVTTGDLDTTIQSANLSVRPKSVDLAVRKLSTTEEIRDGEEFGYQMTIENNGLDPASMVEVTDWLPESLIYQNAEWQASAPEMMTAFEQNGQQLTWSIDFFPVGATLDIWLTVTADDDGLIQNRVSARSVEEDIDYQNNSYIDEKNILPIFIPNVIKPDGDGKNDQFIVRASHKYEQISLLIFNRWGDMVFSADDYENNWSGDGLRGGTYYYQLKGIRQNGNEKQYKGWLQVIKDK
ncbi:MAG: gliding motility-associated C-terminal domain-containing protein [Cyclobacteriaceae bacterium]